MVAKRVDVSGIYGACRVRTTTHLDCSYDTSLDFNRLFNFRKRPGTQPMSDWRVGLASGTLTDAMNDLRLSKLIRFKDGSCAVQSLAFPSDTPKDVSRIMIVSLDG